jgi:hypothetical protein
MASFATKVKGKKVEWNVSVDYLAAKKLKAAGFDIFNQSAYLGGIFNDVPSIIDATVILIAPQLEKAGIALDDFLRSVHGEILDAVSIAMNDALADFFPPARRRIVRMVGEKAMQADAEILAMVESKLTSGDSATNTPEPSASPESRLTA